MSQRNSIDKMLYELDQVYKAMFRTMEKFLGRNIVIMGTGRCFEPCHRHKDKKISKP